MKNLISAITGAFMILHLTAQDPIKNLDQYIQKAIQDWNIPGAAALIVKDDQVLLSKGYGLANSETGAKVNENTVFAIASNSKAFTTAALAQLVEDKKLNWDDKVRDYLPYFELYDDHVSNEFTVRDLVCHRSGLATFSGDLVWYGTSYSREEIVRRAKYLEPKYGFRAHYGYQNIMFIAAGEVVAKVSGMSWEDYITRHFLQPLKMSKTLLSVNDLGKNASAPHNDVDGTNMPIEWVNWDNMGPAGSIISSVNDLSHWVRMQLNKGTWGETTYFSEASSNEMWSAHTPKTLSNFHRTNFPSKHFAAYGLGWDLFDYHGKLVVNHGGGYDGFISHTVLVPEEKLGFVILTNNNTYFPYAMMYNFLDEFLNPAQKTDWGAKFLEFKKADEKNKIENEVTLEEERHKNTSPSLDLAGYTGTYHSVLYGDCEVSLKENQLHFQFVPTPLFQGTFHHWHHDTFRLLWDKQQMLPKGMVQFVFNTKGEIEEMRIDVPNPDFDFTELEFFKLSEE